MFNHAEGPHQHVGKCERLVPKPELMLAGRKSSGLGLSMTFGYLGRRSGYLTIENRLGRG